ncbi:MAG: shikimate kinase [Acidobacteriota bacterium]|nr:shikimate kinase [Acidobacteriota bacterium]
MKTKTSSRKKTSSPKTKSGKSKTNFRGIVLLGFMGAGKTSVASLLAEKLNCQGIDLDEIIETSERKSISELFEKFGEEVFREIEAAALREVLASKTVRVIALGGGAWTIEENRQAARDSGFASVWLDAPFELCWARIKKENGLRPLATKKTEARKLFNKRQKIYTESDLRIEIAEHDSPETIAEKILQSIETSI